VLKLERKEKEMKFNLKVEVDDEEHLKDEIIYQAAEVFITKVLGNRWDDKSLYSRFEEAVVQKLEIIMDVDFKKAVAEKVTENLANKYEKTKQYKSLIENEEILSDGLIKTGLRGLVGDIVRSEMKKVFK